MKKTLTIFTIFVFALALSVAPALADRPHQGGHHGGDADQSVDVDNDSVGSVTNMINVNSNTGLNLAMGSAAGDGGDAGDIESAKDADNTTGDGGNGGNGGTGGEVYSGDISVGVAAYSTVNTNLTSVNRCACQENNDSCDRCDRHSDRHSNEGDANDDVDNDNEGSVSNMINVNSNTGLNLAMGSRGGDGDDAGDIEGDKGRDRHEHHSCHESRGGDDNTTGDGGDGGDGDMGGMVMSGDIMVGVEVVDVVNSNVTRIRR